MCNFLGDGQHSPSGNKSGLTCNDENSKGTNKAKIDTLQTIIIFAALPVTTGCSYKWSCTDEQKSANPLKERRNKTT